MTMMTAMIVAERGDETSGADVAHDTPSELLQTSYIYNEYFQK